MASSDSVNNFVEGAVHVVSHNALAFIGFLTRGAVKVETGIPWLGLIPAYIMNAFISYRDYKFEENRLRNFYEPEIAAKLGKKPENVTIKDLRKVSETNPTIAEALQRNKLKRNMEFAISSICITAAIAVTAFVLGPALGIAPFLLGMAVGLPTFMLLDRVLEPVGKRLLGLQEPRMNAVHRNPRLQSELSVPSQVQYLERMQNHKQTITAEQVKTLLATVNIGAARRMDPCMLQQLADDLNTRQVRAQELAFFAYGQRSGIPRLESPRVTMLEKVNTELKQKLAVTQEKLGEATAQVREKVQVSTKKVGEKLGICKPQTCMAVPDHQFMMRETVRTAERRQNMGQQLAPAT